jgi:hypothetical protein
MPKRKKKATVTFRRQTPFEIALDALGPATQKTTIASLREEKSQLSEQLAMQEEDSKTMISKVASREYKTGRLEGRMQEAKESYEGAGWQFDLWKLSDKGFGRVYMGGGPDPSSIYRSMARARGSFTSALPKDVDFDAVMEAAHILPVGESTPELRFGSAAKPNRFAAVVKRVRDV